VTTTSAIATVTVVIVEIEVVVMDRAIIRPYDRLLMAPRGPYSVDSLRIAERAQILKLSMKK
jgi:hypothetical protein